MEKVEIYLEPLKSDLESFSPTVYDQLFNQFSFDKKNTICKYRKAAHNIFVS